MKNRIASTSYGRLHGIPGRDPSITVFRGIPYAEPPVGTLRWRAPQKPHIWMGLREADRFEGMCPQHAGQFMPIKPVEDYYYDEDCLYLNVYAPNHAETCPVLVWFHGGGLQGGSGSDPMFNGETFARQGIVVVTINYRVGILGFLAHPEMRAESELGTCGNFGVLDQIAALEWVHDNIAAFGGDPDTVTIAGQSAGGGSVCNMITSPLAKGLFHRAIIESGDSAINQPTRPQFNPETIGVELAEKLGDGTLASLRSLPVDQLVRVDYDAAIAHTGKTCGAWIDGVILPQPQSVCLNSEAGNNVPMIVGSNLDEGFLGPRNLPYSEVLSTFGDEATQIAEAYPAETPEESSRAMAKIGSAQWKLRLALWSNKRANKLALPTWHYQFCYRMNFENVNYDACHSAELIYVWASKQHFPPETRGNLCVVETEPILEATINRYWGNFIKTGNPNGVGLPIWPCKSEAPESHMRLDAPCRVEDDIAESREALLLPSLRRALEME